MIQRGSKISLLMLIVVFCAFTFIGCGNGDNVTTNDTTDSMEESTPRDTEDTTETTDGYDQVKLVITEPGEDSVAEGGTLHIVGKAEGTANPGTDKVFMELISDDDHKLGEASSLVADLDYEFSADLKYEISDNMKKNDDGTIDAELHVFMKDNNNNPIKEETLDIKVK